jgi:hypothetical protein
MDTALDTRPRARVLVVTDHPDGPPGLLDAIRARAEQGPAQFRILVTNPAQAEAHVIHPERHVKATEAEQVLHASLPALAAAAGAPVLATVSVRHDPYLAVEELLGGEPIDEFIVDVAQNGFTRRLHLDLPHRLGHLGLPITTVPPDAAPRT